MGILSSNKQFRDLGLGVRFMQYYMVHYIHTLYYYLFKSYRLI